VEKRKALPNLWYNREECKLEENTRKSWLWRILDFINPLRDPSLTVAAVLTFVEEAGQLDSWYSIILIAFVNWLAVRGVVWLIVNFTFASIFIGRRVWWAMQHPRLAWRLLDAIGHEEIVIGNMPSLSESIVLQDGTTIMSPDLGASGIHVIGELPAGTQLPMLGMPGMLGSTQNAPQPSFNTNGFVPGADTFAGNSYNGQPAMDFPQAGRNGFISSQSTDGLPQSFPQRSTQEEERLREQLEAISHMLEDWIQFTEEKWRTVSDSQLGWKALHGRWSNWDDIFQDVYAAKMSDAEAEAARLAGDATGRRFETAKEKGSAASAVACFIRDMLTLRHGLDMVLQNSSEPRTEGYSARLGAKPLQTSQFSNNNTSPNRGSSLSNSSDTQKPRNTLIRRPAPIFVDADTNK
jgi:hypothetical protein